MTVNKEDLFSKLETMGEETVRLKLAQGVFAPQRKRDLVALWLSEKEKACKKKRDAKLSKEGGLKPDSANVWIAIQKDYDISKRGFGKKIRFVTDPFRKKIIFRDTEQAYILANSGFSKPAVILAGSVIEELLRIYLSHKGIASSKNTFDGYIKACEDNGVLKSAIHRLTDSIRQFRNLVHLEKESSARYTISRATAMGAVSSIFTITNDF
jgi:hypothetical protein